jgi:hypothetical protein
MLREEARVHRQVGLLLVAIDLEETAGLILTDGEVNALRSLDDLACGVVGRLPPGMDREARAAELVAEAARRVAPQLLGQMVPEG